MTSRIAAIKAQITQEYLAGQSGLYGLAAGVSRHRFLTAKTERIGTLRDELHTLIGDQATALVAEEPTRNELLPLLQHELGDAEDTAFFLDYIQDTWETYDLLIDRFGRERAHNIINAQSYAEAVLCDDQPSMESFPSGHPISVEKGAELARLVDQDRLFTQAQGGLFPALSKQELPEQGQMLDLACGPGGWVCEVAFRYPQLEVAGVDLSERMVAYANASALSQHLGNVTFGIMDITQPLDFSDNTSDSILTCQPAVHSLPVDEHTA